jgi:hypothetical protein
MGGVVAMLRIRRTDGRGEFRCPFPVVAIAAAVVPLLVLCSLGVLPNPLEAYAAERHSQEADGFKPPSIFPYLGYDVPPASLLYPIPEPEELEDPSRLLPEKMAEDVSANAFLRVEANVRDRDGTPARNAEVVFEWTWAGVTETYKEDADGDGVATMTRWLDSELEGSPTLVVVTAESTDWANSDYTWFVPE